MLQLRSTSWNSWKKLNPASSNCVLLGFPLTAFPSQDHKGYTKVCTECCLLPYQAQLCKRLCLQCVWKRVLAG